MTKEEVAEIVAYCEENKISYIQRLTVCIPDDPRSVFRRLSAISELQGIIGLFYLLEVWRIVIFAMASAGIGCW